MAALLPPDMLAFMAKGVSVIVGSRDANLRPSLMRAVGSRVEDGGRVITVYLARRQSRQLLQDLAAYLGRESGVALSPDQVWAANGSNEIMLHVLQAFGGPGRTALSFAPTY